MSKRGPASEAALKRIAPSTGYDFGAKRHYRRDIWAKFKKLVGVNRYRAQALLMPSAEGDEIEVALQSGFREENLHLVDANPAIAAHLKRRFPRATCYGVAVEDAAERLASRGIRLNVANLDLCGHVTGRSAATVNAFMETGAMLDAGAVAITVLRGREKGDAVRFASLVLNNLGESSLNDDARIFLVKKWIDGYCHREAIRYGCELLNQGVYRSTAGNQTMLWSVFRLNTLAQQIKDARERERQAETVLARLTAQQRSKLPSQILRFLRVRDANQAWLNDLLNDAMRRTPRQAHAKPGCIAEGY